MSIIKNLSVERKQEMTPVACLIVRTAPRLRMERGRYQEEAAELRLVGACERSFFSEAIKSEASFENLFFCRYPSDQQGRTTISGADINC